MALRIRVKIPDGMKKEDGTPYTLSDIFDTKTNTFIQYGAQFADYIQVGVSAQAIGNFTVAAAQSCPCDEPPKVIPPVEMAHVPTTVLPLAMRFASQEQKQKPAARFKSR